LQDSYLNSAKVNISRKYKTLNTSASVEVLPCREEILSDDLVVETDKEKPKVLKSKLNLIRRKVTQDGVMEPEKLSKLGQFKAVNPDREHQIIPVLENKQK
jgi:hypothetical protein